MTLSEIKQHLQNLDQIAFQLPNGDLVARHFHVTEVGKVSKHFIDCGGTVRKEDVINFQLWNADDYDHRLHPEKLLHIIELSERTLGLEDVAIEVEYQGDTIGKYALGFDGKNFLLENKHTDCLAKDKCNIPAKPKLQLQTANSSCCDPAAGCC